MVFIKVSDGVETRKLQVSGEVTFSQLQEKLATLFPSSVQDKPLSLQYRDSDGDLITLSSDEELQGALSTLAKDAVLRLHIKRAARSAQPRRPHRHNGGESLFDLIFKPDSSDLWGHFDKQLQQTNSLFQQLWGKPQEEASSENSCCKDKNPHCKASGKDSEDQSQPHCKASGKDSEDQSQPTEQDGDTVKSKPTTEEPVNSKTESSKDQTPVIHCQTVLSYEPRVQHTWFGPRTVLKPVRYNVVYWGQPDQPADKKSDAETTPTTADKPAEPAPQETTVN